MKALRLMVRQAKPILAATILVASMHLLTACYVPPVWDDSDAIKNLEDIEIGETSRAELVAALGEPDSRFDALPHVIRYRGRASMGLWFIAAPGAGIGGLIDQEAWWVTAVFDDNGILAKLSNSRQVDAEALKAFLVPGATTRPEIIARISAPSRVWEERRVLVFSWEVVDFALTVGAPMPRHVNESWGDHLLLIALDEDGAVKRYERAERPSTQGYGEFLRNFAEGESHDE